jgi:hypothetical protein
MMAAFRGVAATFALAMLLVAGMLSPALSQDKVVGAVWEVKLRGSEGQEGKTWKMRCTPDKKVWNVPMRSSTSVPRVIGKWKGTPERTELVVEGPVAPGNRDFLGTYEFVQVGKDPPLYRGRLTAKGGGASPVIVKLVAD